jgi:hypothetical protein
VGTMGFLLPPWHECNYQQEETVLKIKFQIGAS